MKRTDVSSIGRALDPAYATNRAIVFSTLVVTIGGLLWQRGSGASWISSARWGAQAGLTVFLAWALCRELDPDHPMSAFPAAGLALIAALVWALPKLSAVLWLVVLVRVVNHSTGLPAGVLDASGLVALAGWLSLPGNWGYSLLTALGLYLDSQLSEPVRRQRLFAVLSSIVTVMVAILGSGPSGDASSLVGGLTALGLACVFLPVVLAYRSVDSGGDQTGERLTSTRVQAAQVLALLAGIETAIFEGPRGLVTLAPLWASVVGSSLTWLSNRLASLDLSS